MTTQNSSRRQRPAAPAVRPEGAFQDLMPKLQKAVARAGYETPTPIQEQCIRPLLEGRDMIGTAQTGTGKTAAFALPLLQHLAGIHGQLRKGTPRALILAPTRELAAQIGDSIRTYGRYLHLRHTVIFGGVNQTRQVKALAKGVDVLVATPGRLMDLMGQGFIHLNEVRILVLDEVDRMLDMGFIPDVKRILGQVPAERQSLFFSATMTAEMEALARGMVRNPVRVSIAPEQPAVERISQQVLFVGKKSKTDLLISLLEESDLRKVIVFTQMKHMANRVVSKLTRAGITAAAIHGNKSQNARTKALTGFKSGTHRVLVATDVAARGLDVDDITHVINYNLPVEAETYVHRIGRTARAGAEGDAISFCSAEEKAYLNAIETLLGEGVPQDLDHAFHCETARTSTLPRPPIGRQNNRRSNSSGRGSQRRSRGRRRRRGNRAGAAARRG